MTKNDVYECLETLVNKKCEGYDRIPLCCLYDVKSVLLAPFANLFTKIYLTQKIPEQWKVSKIIPIFKKGNANQIENYLNKRHQYGKGNNNKLKGMSSCHMRRCLILLVLTLILLCKNVEDPINNQTLKRLKNKRQESYTA